MIFDTTEKKLEVTVTADSDSLLSVFHAVFWHDLVKQAGADVLSRMVNSQCCAYLLSESSLFVWHDRLLLITCGNTNVIQALKFLLPRLQAQLNVAVESIYYQQELTDGLTLSAANPIKSALEGLLQQSDLTNLMPLQPSSVPLNKTIPLLCLHYCTETAIKKTRHQWILKNIDATILAQLQQQTFSGLALLTLLGIEQLLTTFTLDEYFFQPYGYSLNAIKGDLFFTVHVSPEKLNNCITLEGNFDFSAAKNVLVENLKPRKLFAFTL